MDEFFHRLDYLQCCLLPDQYSSGTRNRSRTAVFQIVSGDIREFQIKGWISDDFTFQVFYRHQGQLYPHPFELQRQDKGFPLNPQSLWSLSLFLRVKRLDDFHPDDLRRFFEAIDDNLDAGGYAENLHDFHEIYIHLYHNISGRPVPYLCNNGLPLRLPTFFADPWSYENTMTRFRYEAEKRNGEFPCHLELKYLYPNNAWYKIVLCLVSNTIPPRMDCHSIRWSYKMKTKVKRPRTGSLPTNETEKSGLLNQSLWGIVIAEVFGRSLEFRPDKLYSADGPEIVRSIDEPPQFRRNLEHSSVLDNSVLAIDVLRDADFPNQIRGRTKNAFIHQYLPFGEFFDPDQTTASNSLIKDKLNEHKNARKEQLHLNTTIDQRTFNTAHVRLHAAAYSHGDVLVAEFLSPPIRDSKKFAPLNIIRIVQPKFELHAADMAFAYCEYDNRASKSDYARCPYEFQLVFSFSPQKLNEDEQKIRFRQAHACVPAEYVDKCPDLLQFKVPDHPQYHGHRVFIRLRHTNSKDYNTSKVCLNEDECWIYYALSTSVANLQMEQNLLASERLPEPTAEVPTGLTFQNSTENRSSSVFDYNDDDELDPEPFVLNTPDPLFSHQSDGFPFTRSWSN